MTYRIRPARTHLTLGLAAFALLHGSAFAAQLPARRLPEVQLPELELSEPQLPESLTPALIRYGFDSRSSFNSMRKEWLLYALRSRRHEEAALVRLVERRGSAFLPNAEDEKELRAAGATDLLLEAVRKNYLRQKSGGGMGVGTGIGMGGMGVRPGTPDGGGPGSAEPVDYTRPFRAAEVTRRAIITFKPEPGFTKEARKNNVGGVVRLRAVLHANGEVTDISIVRGLPDGLTEQAIDAAKQVRFRPAEKDGRLVSQHVVFEYNFDRHFDEDEVDERAIILEKPEAEYPEEVRRKGVRGKVVLKVLLTNYGQIALLSVEKKLSDGLTQKAIAAAERIKFEPARLEGLPVSQVVTVEYVFAP